MALKIVRPQPGRSPYYYVRGTYAGRTIDASTKTRNEKDARKFKAELERKLNERKAAAHRPGTFQMAAEMFKAFKGADYRDTLWIDRICEVIGDTDLADIRQDTLVKLANELYPETAPETRNRQALTPAAAVLHYAAENNLCPYIRVRKFKTKEPIPRFLTKEQARVVIAGTEGKMKLLVIWLFFQGWRISDALRLKWSDLDLKAETVRYHIRKTDDFRMMPLHPRAIEALGAETAGVGRIFPWQNKANLYRAMRKLSLKFGFHFTPHMARHSFATWLANDGVSPLEIMEAGGWKDHKSVLRYAKLDPNRIRATIRRIT